MRLIDADVYAAEMKKRQDACMDAMADAHSDRMYTENEHWAGVLAAFAEAKITLDKMPTVSGWVSVKDRLPDETEDVIICYEWVGFSGIKYREVTVNDLREVKQISDRIIAWMPLPEPPKEDDND